MKKVDNRPENPDNSMWTLFGFAWVVIAVTIVWSSVSM